MSQLANLTIRQMRAFVAIARWRSFTRAAEEIHITQAGLSLMVRDMESQLGCRLFERTTRSVRLTAGGAQLLPVADRVLRDLIEVADRLGSLSSGTARSIRVAATPLFSAELLPAVCRALESRSPPVRVIVRDTGRTQVQQQVESGEADVGLGILFRNTSSVESERLLDIPLVCAGAPRLFPSEKRSGRGTDKGFAWARLREVPLLALPPDNAIQLLVDQQLKAIGRASEPRPTFGNLHTLLAMAEAGHGVAILPSFVLAARRRYDLRFEVLRSPVVQMAFCAIRRRGSERPPSLDPFLQTLTEHLAAS
ncbi:MAG TPA: LysR family transcriptional regulator [Burkholderiaceae bacterium]|nr:LysR family transcriptional regulator [Burkholderiaceae bacterium]